jgi:hypothetical protein
METTTQKEKLTFLCSCNGCRQVPKRFDSSHVEAIAQETEGFYFSANTRKFFGVRLTGFYTLGSGGVVVTATQKAGFSDSEGREINHAYFCKFGNLVQDFHYKTKTQSRKGLFRDGAELVDACACHGCQIERAGAQG